MMIHRLLILAAIVAAVPAGASASSFDPLAFFTGQTRGEGKLKIMLQRAVAIRVESRGKPDGRGGLYLQQTIYEGNKPARDRHWILRPTSATTLSGTISDNPGPVQGRLVGNVLRLNYSMNGGLKAEQTLAPDPSGKFVRNRMTVRRFGLVVAHIDEIIRKLD